MIDKNEAYSQEKSLLATLKTLKMSQKQKAKLIAKISGKSVADIYKTLTK